METLKSALTSQRLAKLRLFVPVLVLSALFALPILVVMWWLIFGQMEDATHLWRTMLPPYIFNTLGLLTIVGLLSTCMGVSSAWIVTAIDFPFRKTLSWLLVLPLAAPAYIVAYAYTEFLDTTGPFQSVIRQTLDLSPSYAIIPGLRGLWGAAIMLSLVLYPYIYVAARASFLRLSTSQFLAARSLGMPPWKAFFNVVLPCSRLAIIAGLSLVLMETLADFGVADYFALPTLSTGVFRTWLALGDKVAALKIAGIMLIFAFTLLYVERLSRRGKLVGKEQSTTNEPMFKVKGPAAIGLLVLCSLPVILGFVIPVLILLHSALSFGDQQTFSQLMGYAWNSVRIAFIVAILAVIISIVYAYAKRRAEAQQNNSRVISIATRISTIGYALPGTVLAVGLLMFLSPVDRAFTGWLNQTFGSSFGLILTGTMVALVYALIVRFLTVAFNNVDAGSASITPAMDAAARSLGATPIQLIKRIHIPLLRPSLAAALCLVFIDVKKELPATLILRPFNFETLATRVYRLASDERLSEASTAALLIILVSTIPVIIFNRLGK
jgi:iron(III) transport system permease protein